MPSSKEYNELAAECITLAEQTPDPTECQELARMAISWTKLATYKAVIEKTLLHNQPSPTGHPENRDRSVDVKHGAIGKRG